MLAAPAAALAISAARWRLDYVGNVSGRQAIYSADASGVGPLAVLSPDQPTMDFSSPVPSPDGRYLAFSDGRQELIARSDGSSARVLTTGSSVTPVWSPDSTQIAWIAYDRAEGAALHVARADSLGDRVVLAFRVDNRDFAGAQVVWSGDSRHVRVRTGPPPESEYVGHWQARSPDGRLLAYITPAGIAILDAHTRRTRLLTHDLGSQLTWSPDGTMLAYVDCCTNPNSVGVGDIRTVTRTGTVRVVVRASSAGVVTALGWARSDPSASYRPYPPVVYTTAPVAQLAADGDRVAYAACGALNLWTPAGGSVAVGPPLGGGCGPGAYRDVYTLALAGDRLAYGTIAGGLTKSWAVSTDVFGQSPQLLTSANGEFCVSGIPVVAGHGSLVVYADRTGYSTYSSSTYTWTVRASGGQPLISFEQNPFVPVALDVDGDRVLVAIDGTVDVVLSESGGTIFHLDVAVDPSLPPFQHKPPDAQLDGAFVAVRDGDNVHVYDVNSGSPLHTWPLPSGSTLQDSAHGLLAVRADGEVYVVRLTDGLRARVAAGTLAAFMDDGLAIANGASVSVVPYDLLPSFAVRTTAAFSREHRRRETADGDCPCFSVRDPRVRGACSSVQHGRSSLVPRRPLDRVRG
jgi:hypothetical protein